MKLYPTEQQHPNTPPQLKEYRIDGIGPVGTVGHFRKMFPTQEFILMDSLTIRG